MSVNDHEQVSFFYDAQTKCRVIIAVHNTTLGPSLGGCRFLNYPDEQSAIKDVLRLSRGMTYKSAVAGLPLGGGKSVIIGDHRKLRSVEFFHSYAEFVNSLGGKYICSVDMNTTLDDLVTIKQKTDYVAGLPKSCGGLGSPSPFTAYGVFEGLKFALKYKLEKSDFSEVKVAISGLGAVGSKVCDYLYKQGACLYVADIDQQKLEIAKNKYNAQVVGYDRIHASDVEVYVPCAGGGILNDFTIPEIKAKIIAGAANNQLLDEHKHAKMLHDREILYCPDFIINSGGIISAYYGYVGYTTDHVFAKTAKIPMILQSVFEHSRQNDVSPVDAATNLGKQTVYSKQKSKIKS